MKKKKRQTWAEPAGPRLFCRLLGESVRSRRSVRLAEFFVLSSSFPAIRGHSNQLEVPSMVKSRERERVHPLTMIRLNSGLGRRGDMLNSSVSQLGLKHGELCEEFFFFFLRPAGSSPSTELGVSNRPWVFSMTNLERKNDGTKINHYLTEHRLVDLIFIRVQ